MFDFAGLAVDVDARTAGRVRKLHIAVAVGEKCEHRERQPSQVCFLKAPRMRGLFVWPLFLSSKARASSLAEIFDPRVAALVGLKAQKRKLDVCSSWAVQALACVRLFGLQLELCTAICPGASSIFGI